MTTAQALHRLALLLPLLALAGCDLAATGTPQPPPRATAPAAPSGVTETALQRPASARPVASLDASAAEKAAASRPAAAGARLGTTIASLGDATKGGFWIRTPLVQAAGKGRLVDPSTGKSVNVDLIPLPGPASAGSQVSLPVLTTLGVGLTDLPEVEVYRN
ncbi:hypothetical protein [Paracoccus sp. (in: a-proteobacteria)]